MLKLDGTGRIELVGDPSGECGGLFFRCATTSYRVDGRIVFHQEFRLLKRMSCCGCGTCQSFWEEIDNCGTPEESLELQSTGHGRVYRAEYNPGTPDWETGSYDCGTWQLNLVSTKGVTP